MDTGIGAALDWLQKTHLAVTIRDSLLFFPLLESAHVIGLAIVALVGAHRAERNAKTARESADRLWEAYPRQARASRAVRRPAGRWPCGRRLGRDADDWSRNS